MTIDWEERYRQDAAPWERGDLHPAFRHWQAAGTFDGIRHVLVPGAGRAPEPLAFARLGVRPTIVDLAPSAIRHQERAFAAAGAAGDFVLSDLLAYTPERPFDAVYDQTAMCALPPALWVDYAARLGRWLAPGGRLFALFLQRPAADEKGPPFHQDVARMRTLFAAPTWRWESAEPVIRVPHPAGFEELGFVLRCESRGRDRD